MTMTIPAISGLQQPIAVTRAGQQPIESVRCDTTRHGRRPGATHRRFSHGSRVQPQSLSVIATLARRVRYRRFRAASGELDVDEGRAQIDQFLAQEARADSGRVQSPPPAAQT